jgi:hypothetical protein
MPTLRAYRNYFVNVFMVSPVPTGFEGSKVRNRLILLGGGLKNGLILVFFAYKIKAQAYHAGY